MQLSSLLILAISAATSVNAWSCPSSQPSYCGWFDQSNDQNPCCVTPPPAPRPHPKPSCGSGLAAYCAKDPFHFCPYDETNEFCVDDGTTHCDCYDETLTVVELEVVLGDIFCTLEKAYEELGADCLCSDICVAAWVTLELGCTTSDLVALDVDADVSVIGIDIGVGISIGI